MGCSASCLCDDDGDRQRPDKAPSTTLARQQRRASHRPPPITTTTAATVTPAPTTATGDPSDTDQLVDQVLFAESGGNGDSSSFPWVFVESEDDVPFSSRSGCGDEGEDDHTANGSPTVSYRAGGLPSDGDSNDGLSSTIVAMATVESHLVGGELNTSDERCFSSANATGTFSVASDPRHTTDLAWYPAYRCRDAAPLVLAPKLEDRLREQSLRNSLSQFCFTLSRADQEVPPRPVSPPPVLLQRTRHNSTVQIALPPVIHSPNVPDLSDRFGESSEDRILHTDDFTISDLGITTSVEDHRLMPQADCEGTDDGKASNVTQYHNVTILG